MDRLYYLFVASVTMLFISVVFNVLFAIRLGDMKHDVQQMRLDYVRVSLRCGMRD